MSLLENIQNRLHGFSVGWGYGRAVAKKCNAINGQVVRGVDMRGALLNTIMFGDDKDTHEENLRGLKESVENWFLHAERQSPEMYEYLAELCVLVSVESAKVEAAKPEELEA